MNVYNRLRILSRYFRMELEALQKAAIEIREMTPDSYLSQTHVYDLFKKPRVGAAGRLIGPSASSQPKTEDVELLFRTCQAIAIEKSFEFSDDGRIDAPLIKFLRFCKPNPEFILETIEEENVSIFRYFSDFNISKKEFLPDEAVLPNDIVRRHQALRNSSYRLLRQVSYPKGDHVLARESLEIVSENASYLEYVDHRKDYFRGPLFVSEDRMVSLVFSQKSRPYDLRYALITIFHAGISDEEFAVSISRSGFHERKTHSYSSVAQANVKNTHQTPFLGPYTVHELKYFTFMNSLYGKRQASPSHITSHDDARDRFLEGERLVKRFLDSGMKKNDEVPFRKILETFI